MFLAARSFRSLHDLFYAPRIVRTGPADAKHGLSENSWLLQDALAPWPGTIDQSGESLLEAAVLNTESTNRPGPEDRESIGPSDALLELADFPGPRSRNQPRARLLHNPLTTPDAGAEAGVVITSSADHVGIVEPEVRRAQIFTGARRAIYPFQKRLRGGKPHPPVGTASSAGVAVAPRPAAAAPSAATRPDASRTSQLEHGSTQEAAHGLRRAPPLDHKGARDRADRRSAQVPPSWS